MVLRFENVLNVTSWREPNKPPKIEIHMEYIGSQLSVNHYLGKSGNRFWVKRDTQKWMDDLAGVIRIVVNADKIKFKPPVKVFIRGIFKNGRAQPDLDNLFKVVCDAVSDGLGIDDKWFTHETGSSELQKFCTPTLIIKISQGG